MTVNTGILHIGAAQNTPLVALHLHPLNFNGLGGRDVHPAVASSGFDSERERSGIVRFDDSPQMEPTLESCEGWIFRT